jgi:hypothetical protein
MNSWLARRPNYYSCITCIYVIIIINNKLTNISDGENDNLYEGIN